MVEAVAALGVGLVWVAVGVVATPVALGVAVAMGVIGTAATAVGTAADIRGHCGWSSVPTK